MASHPNFPLGTVAVKQSCDRPSGQEYREDTSRQAVQLDFAMWELNQYTFCICQIKGAFSGVDQADNTLRTICYAKVG